MHLLVRCMSCKFRYISLLSILCLYNKLKPIGSNKLFVLCSCFGKCAHPGAYVGSSNGPTPSNLKQCNKIQWFTIAHKNHPFCTRQQKKKSFCFDFCGFPVFRLQKSFLNGRSDCFPRKMVKGAMMQIKHIYLRHGLNIRW